MCSIIKNKNPDFDYTRMGKVKRFEPISATCKDCGRDFIITAEEQKRFKSQGE